MVTKLERTGLALFQSTLPQGERLGLAWRSLHDINFNPRSHKGSDVEDLYNNDDISISIHAPTRGATNLPFRKYHLTLISIHAPTRGATIFPSFICTGVVFQSTLPQGERLTKRFLNKISLYFNPRSHKGSDDTF